MKLTRKEFFELSSRAAIGAAAYSSFPLVTARAFAQDIMTSEAVCLGRNKEELWNNT